MLHVKPGTTTTLLPSQPINDWQPVLAGSDRERALTWATRLADELRWLDGASLDASLAAGAAGLAVLFATLSATIGDRRYDETTERFVSLAADRVVADLEGHGAGLFSGLAGVAWAELTVSRLQGRGPVASDDVDELLGDLLAASWSGPWELTAGLVGIGVYALERFAENPRLLNAVIERLADARSPRGGWVVDSAVLFGEDGGGRPDRYVDLGMAHGLAGLVAFTALASRVEAARLLLSEATGALLAHQGSARRASVFSPFVGADPRPMPPRWCYSDLGIAGAMAVAGPLLSHPQVPQALSAVLNVVPVEPPPTVADLGLCHGLAGGAHVLQRVAVNTQRDHAWAAAEGWGRTLLERLDAGDRTDGPGFLEGAAGVALSLLALATDLPPLWDRALLLS